MPEILLILAILLFVFGPSKLPTIAKELGRAWREFTKATTELTEAGNRPTKPKGRVQERNALVGIAKKLNINTEGKTINQLRDQILSKTEKVEKAESLALTEE